MSILFQSVDDPDGELFHQFQRRLPQHQLQRWPDVGDPDAVRYAIAWGPPDEFFNGLGNLEAVLSVAAGVDHLLNHPGLPARLPIIRLSDAGMADKIAEYVHYGVMRARRGYLQYELQQQNCQWLPLDDREPADFRVGILGLGVMGLRTAEVLQSAGYPVVGWRRKNTTGGNQPHCFYGDAELPGFLANLSALVCLLPLTPATRGIIDRTTLKQLPRGCHLINAARGGHVVQEDLLWALDSGQLDSALLDVCEPEPLPADDKLWSHPKVTLTPHIAGPTQREASVEQIVRAVVALDEGGVPTGLVDRAQGY